MVECGAFVGIVAMHANLAESGDFQHEEQFVLEVQVPAAGCFSRQVRWVQPNRLDIAGLFQMNECFLGSLEEGI
jgi:hypothetical protein